MTPLGVSGECQETSTDDGLLPSTCTSNGASSGAVMIKMNIVVVSENYVWCFSVSSVPAVAVVKFREASGLDPALVEAVMLHMYREEGLRFVTVEVTSVVVRL